VSESTTTGSGSTRPVREQEHRERLDEIAEAVPESTLAATNRPVGRLDTMRLLTLTGLCTSPVDRCAVTDVTVSISFYRPVSVDQVGYRCPWCGERLHVLRQTVRADALGPLPYEGPYMLDPVHVLPVEGAVREPPVPATDADGADQLEMFGRKVEVADLGKRDAP